MHPRAALPRARRAALLALLAQAAPAPTAEPARRRAANGSDCRLIISLIDVVFVFSIFFFDFCFDSFFWVPFIDSFVGKEADYEYRILNADGTEVEQCGNGARCVTKFLKSIKTYFLLFYTFCIYFC